MNRRPELLAAILNGLIVLTAPFLLYVVGVPGIDGLGVWRVVPLFAVNVPAGLLPFAALAGWRTYVHARRYREGRSLGWAGVLEAGATALVALLVFIGPMLLRATDPGAAAFGAVIYGTIALSMGLVTGILLRIVALVVLRRFDGPTPAYRLSQG